MEKRILRGTRAGDVLRNRDTKERNGKRDFVIQKHQGIPQEKATATA